MALKIGSKAPEIKLKSTTGQVFDLAVDLKGKPCIIYFYPKDFTPGCTEEACTFRDAFSDFIGLDVTVIGISKDSITSHQKFKEEHNLPFELLSDPKGEVCKSYDALIPLIKIPKRITYLLDAEHKVAAVYQDMFGAKKHIEIMLEKMKSANT
ncbi:peroxiredoxin Q/BCP [Roseivirga ehrenbergii]|uniref:thioredoxin-dependent peroxiredoxin n=1 Tax=Roseivirga ehrenbergii (strain DSM 102268 / JCM 13514 / KCTC 12282 / NCIMB 14502 / KMM 6017) TaxID=279360 RepID=A0A150XEF8_ROSEK|nr:peroxiredoxin [Roseivirga ehrenbergii]KYG77072.1 redoxin domain protein [Roseivirga ehrenbergii]TCL14424.1 peroxiredoxin Q/BCP [Roseivirga ehrenbergii]